MLIFSPFFCTRSKYCFSFVISCSPSNYIENNTWERGDMEFFYQFSTRYLSNERSDFPHKLLQAMYRHKIIKMVNFGKGNENEKK